MINSLTRPVSHHLAFHSRTWSPFPFLSPSSHYSNEIARAGYPLPHWRRIQSWLMHLPSLLWSGSLFDYTLSSLISFSLTIRTRTYSHPPVTLLFSSFRSIYTLPVLVSFTSSCPEFNLTRSRQRLRARTFN